MRAWHLLLSLTPLAAAKLYPGPPKDKQHFDYVIVGGGTAGLVLANRLSADPHTTVAVLEAGADERQNPNVTDVEHFGDALGSTIDWQYPAAPQRFASTPSAPAKPLIYNQGRGLGGTSLINGATYIRSTRPQIDAWESRFGNPGWNWDALFKCYLKSERFTVPTQAQQAAGATYDATVHGATGPVHVGWQTNISTAATFKAVRAAWAAIGFPRKRDMNDGAPLDFGTWPRTLDRDANIRWDAARAYLYPVADRPNLHVFQNTLAEKLLWAGAADRRGKGDAVATGVQAHGATNPGKPLTVYADKEVVLSAGAIKSPALLEASGVGNPAILSKHNIPVKIALPSVGENLQDQPLTPLAASVAHGNATGYPTFVTYPNASAFAGTDHSALEASIRAQIPAYAARIVAHSAPNATTEAIQRSLLTTLVDLSFAPASPAAEILTATQGQVLVLPTWPLLPLSRGSVHLADAASSSSSGAPTIDPQFWLLASDDALAAAALRTARAFARAAHTSGFAGPETAPGPAAVPANAPDHTWAAYAKSAYGPNYHPVGTCAMLARALGGVVDSRLRVYGAANVRVCDASVLPSQTVGHLTSTIYAVAERAAALMLGRDGC